MSYESPITIAYDMAHHVSMEIENGVYKAAINAGIGIDVNKEELIRALQYDRNQYEKGYADGKADGKKQSITHAKWKCSWINKKNYTCYCSHCEFGDGVTYDQDKEFYQVFDFEFCPYCGAIMDADEEEE